MTSSQNEYYEIIKKTHFIASPQGIGIDCHRTWEAIYLKTIPIVIKSPATEYFNRIGLPIFLIDSWDKINNLTLEKLEGIYNNIYNDNSFSQAHMDHWVNEIMNKKI